MAANTNPVFVDTPKAWVGRCVTTNTNRDGTGTIVVVVTPGADGSLVEGIEVAAEGVTTPGYLNLFISDDAGVTWRFWRSVGAFTTATPSATVNNWQSEVSLDYLPLPLATTQRLGAAATIAGNFTVIGRGGDF